jgi:hypothetical protein
VRSDLSPTLEDALVLLVVIAFSVLFVLFFVLVLRGLMEWAKLLWWGHS